MKKILSTMLLLGVYSLSMIGNVCLAEDLSALKGVVNVSSSDSNEIKADVVTISVAVITQDAKSMDIASDDNKKISDSVYSELKSMINAKNGDYVKTSNYTATPLYSYTNGKKIFDKYQVSNVIELKTKSVEKIGLIIDKAISLGATEVRNIQYSLSSTEKDCNILIAEVVKQSKSQAESVAKSAGTSIVGIKNLDVSCSANTQSNAMLMKTISLDLSTGSTPIETGIVKIYASVNAGYLIK
ncbi:MAG: SIMPL domain-containing protein [Candidatus Gastranaerophilales bacterium]